MSIVMCVRSQGPGCAAVVACCFSLAGVGLREAEFPHQSSQRVSRGRGGRDKEREREFKSASTRLREREKKKRERAGLWEKEGELPPDLGPCKRAFHKLTH